MVFYTKPVSKPRMTRSDTWKKRSCVLQYREFKDEISLQAKLEDFELPDAFRVVFGIPFPRSYSKSKREKFLGQPHTIKPDIDNYLKALMDSLKENDSGVWHVDAQKIWVEGSGFISVEPL
jgi:Holliday junction resolvase RusA-like endonuclease